MYNIKINIAADNAVGDPLYMEDWGLKIEFEGLTLPTAYEVHFSNNPASPAKMAIGDSSGVVVPYEFTAQSGTLYGWLVFTNPSSGYTKRAFTVPITRRSPLDPPEVLPEQVTVVDTAIAALNTAIAMTNASAEAAAASAEDAETAATNAANSAAEAASSVEQAAQKVNEAQEAADASATSATAASQSASNALTSATQAAESATAAASSATTAGQSAATAQAAATRAENAMDAARASATAADESATLAQTAMEESTDNAQAAADSATAAAESAASAATSATNASASAQGAATSATAAQTAQSAAEEAASTAAGKASEAGESAADAATSAAEAEAAATEAGQIVDDVEAWALGAYATSSASGAVATVDDGAENVPVKALTAYIVPVQDGSGDPSPDNVRQIHGFTGMEIARNGSNQWDEEWEVGDINADTGQNNNGSITIRSKNYIPIKPRTQYFFCIEGAGTSLNVRARFYDRDKNYLGTAPYGGGPVKYNSVFETPDNAYFIRFTPQVAYGTTYNNNISINYPSTDTDYRPYTGQAYPVTWSDEAGTVYGGYFDAVTGVLTVTHAAVDMGALNWALSSVSNLFFAGTLSSLAVAKPPLCTIFKGMPNVTGAQSAYDFGNNTVCYRVSDARVYARDDRFTDAAAFKTAVTGQTLVYELATPQTYQLTPLDVRTLRGVNNIFADTGDTSATVRADPDLHLNKLIAEAVALALENA